jgi:hypothetical protein
MIRPIILAAALALATPAAAQQATPQENLDCAVWAAYKIGVSQDDQVKNALSIAVAWFIGQYEGQVGEVIDPAMAARAQELDLAAVEALTEPCVERFQAFGDRLSTLGAQLSAASK